MEKSKSTIPTHWKVFKFNICYHFLKTCYDCSIKLHLHKLSCYTHATNGFLKNRLQESYVKKIQNAIVMLLWKITLWLVTRLTNFNQLECFYFCITSYLTLNFVDGVGSRLPWLIDHVPNELVQRDITYLRREYLFVFWNYYLSLL